MHPKQIKMTLILIFFSTSSRLEKLTTLVTVITYKMSILNLQFYFQINNLHSKQKNNNYIVVQKWS